MKYRTISMLALSAVVAGACYDHPTGTDPNFEDSLKGTGPLRSVTGTSTGIFDDLGALGATLGNNRIGNAGDVVGTMSIGGVARAVRASPSGVLEDLGTLSDCPHSWGLDVNGAGVVVGYAADCTTTNMPAQPFRWTPQSGMVPLTNGRSARVFGRAHAINERGDIGGAVAGSSGWYPALWLANGSFVEGRYPSEYRSPNIDPSQDVNETGYLVGTVSRTTASDVNVAFRAFIMAPDGAVTELGTLGGRDSYAIAINAHGTVVGYSTRADGTTGAFRWTGGVMQDLGTLPGGSQARALGINDGGEIAGWSSTVGTNGSRAFRWTAAGGMQNLGLLPGSATNGSSEAVGINNDGVIAGTGSSGYNGGVRHAFRWTEAEGFEDLGLATTDPNQTSVAHGINAKGEVGGAWHQPWRWARWRMPNRPPTAAINGPYTGQEGTALSFSSAGTLDPDGDALTYLWDFGDGQTSSAANPGHSYSDNGSYSVTLTVSDGKGGTDAKTTTATITNVAPVVNAGADVSVKPSTAFSLNASFSDRGTGDAPWSYSVDWGDGSTADTGSKSSQTEPITGSHTYATEGTYTVRVSVTDKDGATTTDAVVVTVSSNRDPLASFTINGSCPGPCPGKRNTIYYPAFDEGQTLTFDASGSSDPDGDPLSYTWNLGGGVTGTGVTVTRVYPDDQSLVSTRLDVIDGKGGASFATGEFMIRNVAPILRNTIYYSGCKSGIKNELIPTPGLTYEITDPGATDSPWQWEMNWGDGTVERGSFTSIPATVSTSRHRYQKKGNYTGVFTVWDKDGGTTQETKKFCWY